MTWAAASEVTVIEADFAPVVDGSKVARTVQVSSASRTVPLAQSPACGASANWVVSVPVNATPAIVTVSLPVLRIVEFWRRARVVVDVAPAEGEGRRVARELREHAGAGELDGDVLGVRVDRERPRLRARRARVEPRADLAGLARRERRRGRAVRPLAGEPLELRRVAGGEDVREGDALGAGVGDRRLLRRGRAVVDVLVAERQRARRAGQQRLDARARQRDRHVVCVRRRR